MEGNRYEANNNHKNCRGVYGRDAFGGRCRYDYNSSKKRDTRLL